MNASDHEQRTRALDTQRSFLVTAPAGSGKTEVLVRRVLALLATVNEPEEILVATFTLKATGELLARIVDALMAGRGEAPSDPLAREAWELARKAAAQDEARGWQLVDNPHRLNIKTIDAFCGSLVRRAPLAGTVGTSTVLDDPTVAYRAAARAILRDLEGDAEHAQQVEALLSHLDMRFDRAEALLVALLGRREQWLPIILAHRNRSGLRAELEGSLLSVRRDLISRCREALAPHASALVASAQWVASQDDPGIYGQALAALAEAGTLPSPTADDFPWESLAGWLTTQTGDLRRQGGAREGFPAPSGTKDKAMADARRAAKAAFKDLLEALADDGVALGAIQSLGALPPARYGETEVRLIEALLVLLPVLAGRLLLAFQELGGVDHVEVATAARRVLGSEDTPTDLAVVLDTQLRHVLFDEFQDTNEAQVALLASITRDWTPGDGRTVFLVGDPMQSIYGFRGSNVGLFLQAESGGIGGLTFECLHLTDNFRSAAQLVEWVNDTFADVFPATADSNLGITPYRPARPFQGAAAGAAVSCHCFDEATEGADEARWIAEEIRAVWKDSPDASVAVLVEQRNHLRPVLAALQAHDLPYQAIDIDPLADLPVIRDLSALTSAILNPANQTEWLAVLHGPLVGLPLEALRQVMQGGKGKTVWGRMRAALAGDLLSGDDRERLAGAAQVLGKTLQNRERKPLAQLVEGAWLALNGPSVADEAADLAHANRFIGLLREQGDAIATHEDLQRAVAGLYSRPAPVSGPAVQVMTMHKSKGLQFDAVFLPALNNRTRSQETPLLVWDRYETGDGAQHPLLSAAPAIGDDRSPLLSFLLAQQARRAALERARLLYVACTRAKRRLYLSGSFGVTDEGELRAPSASRLMGLLWSRIGEGAEIHPARDLPGADRAPADDGLRRRAHRMLPVATTGLIEPLADYAGIIAGEQAAPAMSWEPPLALAEGSLVHEILQLIARDGLEAWPDSRIVDLESQWQGQLEARGVPPFAARDVAARVVATVRAARAGDNGTWVLKTRPEAASELPLWLVDEERSVVIDRVFVENGVRYLVEYKTDRRRDGESDAAFGERLWAAHHDQVERYRDALSRLSPEPVQPCLYLPAEDLLLSAPGASRLPG